MLATRLAWILFALSTTARAAGPAAPTDTRTIMQTILEPMTEILALSFEGDVFQSPLNRPKVSAWIDALAANVGRLEAHGKSQDRTFEFVARSLATDARRLSRYYKQKRYDEARFTLHNMTENCIACHSSLPAGGTKPDAKWFMIRVAAPSLQPVERAHLQTVTRQFDDALASYEQALNDPKAEPTVVIGLGSLSDYLKLAVDVKSDFKRPQAVFERLKSRPTTPLHVRMQLDRWLAALKTFDTQRVLEDPKPLDRARALLQDARALMDFPRDRDALVHFVTADALLARYIHGRGSSDRGKDLGEAYYLRGIAESLLEHSFWITRSDFYFESAIRLAPAAEFAPKAYARLSESLLDSYTGSRGTDMPTEAQGLLTELRTIIAQAQGQRI